MFFMGSDATSLADLVLGRTWSGQQISVLKAGQIQSDWKCACRICASYCIFTNLNQPMLGKSIISGGATGRGFGARCQCLLQGAPRGAQLIDACWMLTEASMAGTGAAKAV